MRDEQEMSGILTPGVGVECVVSSADSAGWWGWGRLVGVGLAE